MFNHIDYKLKIAKNHQDIDALDAKNTSNKLVSSIVFVTLAENEMVDEGTALEHTDLFAEWEVGVEYKNGNIRVYEGELYRCLQSHLSQQGWEPNIAVSLWKKIGDPTVEYPEWSQPIGADDAYNTGDKVSHNDKHWISTADNNVWEPGVYGWEEVIEENE